MPIYKTLDLFGKEQLLISSKAKGKPNLFSDYDAFTEKFEPKKTTDDCYTPEPVFQVIIEHVNEKYSLEGKRIVRPFYPGGDFEAIDYGADDVVIDNPPFSIIAKIARFYVDRKIPFFLFAPHLTLFGSDIDCTHIVTSADIVYENGAVVKTSFLSNMFGDVKVLGDAELHAKLKALNKPKNELPKYEYPDNVLTVSMVAKWVEKGVSFSVNKNQVAHCRGLDDQKKHGKAIFGSGFLISEKAAAEKAAAEKAAAEKAAAEKAAAEKAAAEKAAAVYWQLSEKEKNIIIKLF
jgi:hypothetical protein